MRMLMEKARRKRSIPPSRKDRVIEWLPIDSRLLPDIFSFHHVTGLARVFLEIEIALSVLIVFGTCVLVVMRLFSYMR